MRTLARRACFVISAAVFVLNLTSIVYAKPYLGPFEEWQYPINQPSYTIAIDQEPDENGDRYIYIAGYGVITKYDKNGNVKKSCSCYYDSEYIAVSKDSVYVAGSLGGDSIFIYKVDKELEDPKHYIKDATAVSPQVAYCDINGIAADKDAVYITGTVHGYLYRDSNGPPVSDVNYFVVKLDGTSLTELDKYQSSVNSQPYGIGNAIALSKDYIYLLCPDGATDFVDLDRFEKGNLKNRKTGSVEDPASSIAVDPSGNVYVAGYTDGNFGVDLGQGGYYGPKAQGNAIHHLYVAKLNFDLSFLNACQIPLTDNFNITGLSADKETVFVAGMTTGELPGCKNAGSDTEDVFMVVFDNKLQHFGSFQTGTPTDDWTTGFAVGPTVGIYIMGNTRYKPNSFLIKLQPQITFRPIVERKLPRPWEKWDRRIPQSYMESPRILLPSKQTK